MENMVYQWMVLGGRGSMHSRNRIVTAISLDTKKCFDVEVLSS